MGIESVFFQEFSYNLLHINRQLLRLEGRIERSVFLKRKEQKIEKITHGRNEELTGLKGKLCRFSEWTQHVDHQFFSRRFRLIFISDSLAIQ
jgi:hypothetical protein